MGKGNMLKLDPKHIKIKVIKTPLEKKNDKDF